MSLLYRFLYRTGWTPWVREQPGEPIREAAGEHPRGGPGAALDLGCGQGTDALFLAAEGWGVTAVDSAPRALQLARRRPGAGSVRWLRGDVRDLSALGLQGGYDLVLDVGCFHGLSDRDRHLYAGEVGELSNAGALMLLFAFPPGRRPAHRGIRQEQLMGHFATGWELESANPDLTMNLGGEHPTWYRLKRRD